MKSKIRYGVITISILSILIYNFVTPSTSRAEECFSDVNPGEPHYIAICRLKEQGVIGGYSDNTFKPYAKITRAEALKMITEASGFFDEHYLDAKIQNLSPSYTDNLNDTEGDLPSPFPDTPTTEWYIPYLVQAKDLELIAGYEDGNFYPNKNIQLSETLKIYIESLDSKTFPENKTYFNDVPENSWSFDYFSYAAELTAVIISPTNTVNPNQEMTRGYMAEVIYRLKTAPNGSRFGKATYYGAAVQGNGTASGERFDYNKPTAAHKTLPFGTMVEVTNLANGKKVTVKINDRGPYGHGREIDLSSSAFSQIGSLSTGVITVEYKIVE